MNGFRPARRVIPASHRLDGDRFAREMEEHALESADAWGAEGPDVPAFSLDSRPGDVVVIDQRFAERDIGVGLPDQTNSGRVNPAPRGS